MDEVHRKVLQRNRPYLMKEVLLETLWPHLVAREVFTDEMIEHIQVNLHNNNSNNNNDYNNIMMIII